MINVAVREALQDCAVVTSATLDAIKAEVRLAFRHQGLSNGEYGIIAEVIKIIEAEFEDVTLSLAHLRTIILENEGK